MRRCRTSAHRPSFARRFAPGDYRIDDPSFERLTEAEWRALGQGPALLFVHGTFSTSGGFKAIDPAVMSELSVRASPARRGLRCESH